MHFVISRSFSGLISLPHNLSILESVAELTIQVFRAALAVHDIDADSAMGTSIITDDRSTCRVFDVSSFPYFAWLQG